jgi:polysaccharide biosynthesis protein PelD
VSEKKSNWTAAWARQKGWGTSKGLPVLPPVGALIELAILMVIIVAIDWAFPALGFTSLEPSPFWLPVLLLSLQYGTVAGLVAAAAATAAYVFNGVAEQAVGENFFSYLLRIWALPILWIGVALVLGQFRLRQIAEKQVLRQDLAKRTAEANHLTGYANDLAARCRRLERELTTRTTAPVKPVLDALAQFADPAAELSAALDSVTTTLWPGAQISVFAVTASGCAAIATSGWPATASWATEIAATHPLHRAMVAERRPVSILFRGDEIVLSGHGMVAQPIISPDGSRVIGMFKIEKIDPALLDNGSVAQLSLMARLLALVLAEPKIVVANDTVGQAHDEPLLARMTRGWRLKHWRTGSLGSEPAQIATTVDLVEQDADTGLSVRPRQSS